MRVPPLVLAACAVLSACATPQERCLQPLTGDLATIRSLIAETEQTIARGFAYRQEVSPVRIGGTLCVGNGYWNNVGVRVCGSNVNDVRQVPVAVDIAAERAKLADLRDREAALAEALPAARAACAARYP